MNDLHATIILNMLEGIGSRRYAALLQACGSAAEVFRCSRGELAAIKSIGSKLAGDILQAPHKLAWQQELQLAERHHIRLLSWQDQLYPRALLNIYDAPPLLYLQGRLSSELPAGGSDINIAIVGSRQASNYALQHAFGFAEKLAAAGLGIISGLALGVDAAAHRGALQAGGYTAAVLGSGLLRIYPRQNMGLAEQILQHGGALISEFSLQTPASRLNFPRRNRIVSALSDGCLVVEAPYKSGSLITAQQANEQGKTVFVLPNLIERDYAAGGLSLLRDGATAVCSSRHIIAELCPHLLADNENDSKQQHRANLPPHATLERRLYELIRRGAFDLESLSQQSGVAAHELLSALGSLELNGCISLDLQGRYSAD